MNIMYYLKPLSVVLAFVAGLLFMYEWKGPGSAMTLVAVPISFKGQQVDKIKIEEHDLSDEKIVLINEQLSTIQFQYTQLTERMSTLVKDTKSLENKLKMLLAAKDSSDVPLSDSNTLIDISQLPSAQERAETMVSGFESILKDEDVDSAWSVSAESEISGIISSDTLNGSELVYAECGSNLCRTEILHSGASQADEFTMQFGPMLGWDSDSFVQLINESDGSVRTILYISRDNYELPNF